MIAIEKKGFSPELCHMAPEWDGLLARSSRPTIYSSFDYVYTSCCQFKGDEDIFFLFFREDGSGRLLAVFPVSVRRITIRGVSLRRVGHAITGATTEVDKPYPIIDRDHEASCWQRFGDYLKKEFRAWDLVEYKEFWVGSSFLQHANRLFPRPRYWVKTGKGPESPIFTLSGEWEDFWNAHKKVRDKLRRIEKQLGDRLSLVVTSDSRDVDRCLDAYIATEQASMKAEEGHMRPEKERFYRELFPKLAAKDQLYFAMLYDGDQVIAVHISYVFGDRVYFALCTFNPEYSKLSPGLVLHFRFIEYFYGKGFAEGDFLAGYAHYLSPWASHSEQSANVLVRKVGWKNGLVALRNLAGKMHKRFEPSKKQQDPC